VIRRILVVDDEPTIREFVSEVLRDAGYTVETAANGAEALQLMQRSLPHGIVLDVMMPKLDAQGFVELARLNPTFAKIPIVVLTAAYAAHETAERLGARACLTKPFELDDLVSVVAGVAGEPVPFRADQPRDRPAALQRPLIAES
jgi:CheY-like chemotaxis protein